MSAALIGINCIGMLMMLAACIWIIVFENAFFSDKYFYGNFHHVT